jgi:hypothetical protein
MVVRGLRTGLALGAAILCCNLYEGRTLELFPELASAPVECRDEGDCPHERAFCAGGACRECLVDRDCGPAKPACDGNVCVECRSADNCAPNEGCNDVLSSCALRCSDESDCAGQPLRRCSSELDVCVQCVQDDDCTEPRNPACDRGGRCVECLVDAHCTPDRPSCDVSARRCVECVDASQCDGQVCDARDGRCVECLVDVDCGAGGTCDVPRHRCQRPCTGDPDCDPKKPTCDLASGLCIECIDDAACKEPGRGACNAEHQCVECVTDEHCSEPGKPACIAMNQRCGECNRDEHCAASMMCDLPAARCAPAPPGMAMTPVAPGPAPAPAPAP